MLINMEQTEEEKIPDVKKDLNLQVKRAMTFSHLKINKQITTKP